MSTIKHFKDLKLSPNLITVSLPKHTLGVPLGKKRKLRRKI